MDGGVRDGVQRTELRLWCGFGSAPLIGEVQDLSRARPKLAGRVHLLGKVPQAHVEALMRAADLFVSGSRAEGCGYSLLEALACGATPVVTDIPAFRALTGDEIGRASCRERVCQYV